MPIDYGFIPDFKGSDTLLFIGDGESLRDFADILSSFARVKNTVELNGSVFRGHSCDVVVLTATGKTSKILRGGELSRLHWLLGSSGALDAAEKLSLLSSVETGHQFLETEGATQIMVSQGEYSVEVFN